MHVRLEELLDAGEREILSSVSQEVNVPAST